MTRYRGLYSRWIVANGWAEAAGLGTTFALGVVVGPRLEQPGDGWTVLATALLAVLLGTVLEGAVVGIAQERALRPYCPGLRRGAWVIATSVGAGLAWVVGMVPSTVMALATDGSEQAAPPDLSAALQYALAAGLGLVTGPILGVAQWVVLRRLVPGASRWLWANAAAWAVGMPLIFVGMDLVPWEGSVPERLISVYAVCGVTGLAVGAIHGLALLGLFRRVSREAPVA